MKSINVLMVDDDMMVQQLAHLALDGRGIKLWKAYDTSEADTILKQQKIDVILCDVVMSPESGLDYRNRLRERAVRTPVIMMSSQVSPLGMKEKGQDNAANYMIKPFAIERIYQHIMEALARQK